MSPTLDYGRRPSRRNWRVLFVALVLAHVAWLGVRTWRLHRARLEDRRLYLEQVKIRQEFDRQLTRQLQRPPPPAPSRRDAAMMPPTWRVVSRGTLQQLPRPLQGRIAPAISI
jgi:hypothetical protein